VSAPRRNEPCPCGSGRRYKDCHGKLAAEAPDLQALVRLALSSHRQGRVDEAERGYHEILARAPGHAVATHYLGLIDWQRGDLARAESRMRAAIAADASIADFHNNLGLLLRDTRRSAEAIECFRAALDADADGFEARNNLGLALEAEGRWDDAIAAYRGAIERQPGFAAARQNLARALLTVGELGEGWAQYRWRLLAQGVVNTAPDAAASRLAAALQGRQFALLAEQGVGDVLFFLRFAAELLRRGARLAFRGDPRLHAMLARSGVFALGVAAENAATQGLEALRIGDLPWLLAADDARRAPPFLALTPTTEALARMANALAAAGPPPYAALTWRAGIAATGPSRTQLKEIDVATLGAALRGRGRTWISVQRLPREGETAELARAIGAPVHDFSACNDDLEAMLALLALASDYIGVSNANTYLRAGLDKPMQVLVAHPPEWRWGAAGNASPWFARARLLRQRADGDWSEAMQALR
jgi:Tfp pilus assembly protein PilF